MLTLKKYIKEDSNVMGTGVIAGKDIPFSNKLPNSHITKRKYRYSLPQVDLTSIQEDLNRNNISFYIKKIPTNDLVPMQVDIDKEKVDFIRKSNLKNDTILVSNDLKIIDGHHRFAANHIDNKETKAFVMGLNFKDSMKFLKGKEYVKKHK